MFEVAETTGKPITTIAKPLYANITPTPLNTITLQPKNNSSESFQPIPTSHGKPFKLISQLIGQMESNNKNKNNNNNNDNNTMPETNNNEKSAHQITQIKQNPPSDDKTKPIKQPENNAPAQNSSTNNRTGGGICSVLLEVIEKLRDAESDNEIESAALTINENSTNSKTRRLKRSFNNNPNEFSDDSDLNKNSTAAKKRKTQLIRTMLDDSKLKSDAIANISSSNNSAKQRKKRTKKLNQLIAMNSNKNFVQNTSNSHEIDADASKEEPAETEECAIETSVVTSLYDDDALLQAETSSNHVNNHLDSTDANRASDGKREENDNDEVDFNFSYKKHNGVLLNDLNIKLIENDDLNNSFTFTCNKCSILFDDLMSLCEHKSNSQCSQDSPREEPDIIKDRFYLCDLCHSNDPLNTISDKQGSILSYYLVRLGDKKIYFKCFDQLEALKQHFKQEHADLNQHEVDKDEKCKKLTDLVGIKADLEPPKHISARSLSSSSSTCIQSPSNSGSSPNFSGSSLSIQTSVSLPSSPGYSSSPLYFSNMINLNSSQTADSNLSKEFFGSFKSAKSLEFIKLLESLAYNDGYEQYACCLCSYVCYHLPSLKSHMWTHVKNEKFDYSLNTSIM